MYFDPLYPELSTARNFVNQSKPLLIAEWKGRNVQSLEDLP